MTVTLETIMDAVADAIETQTGSAAVPHAFGRKQLHVHEICPRIVWARGDTDGYSAARTLGNSPANTQPKPLYTVASAVEVHIWAQTEEQFELLRQTELAAIHRVLHGSYAVTGGKCIEADDAILTLGYSYVLLIQILQPILDAIVATAEIESVGHDVILEMAQGDVHCGHAPVVPPAP